MVGHRHPAHQALMTDDLARRQQMIEPGQGLAGGRPGDLDLLGLRRIIQLDQEHEPVELGLGQRIRPFLLDRVLRGQHQERRLEVKALPTTVTLCSCIASSIAAWVFGGARLISSASTMLAKTGPCTNSNSRRPSGRVLKNVRAVMSIGIRSGVNWIRLNFSDIVSASLLTSNVLASPGTPMSKRMPPREQADRQPLDHSRWPTMTRAISLRSRA